MPARLARAVQEEWGQGLIRSWNSAGWYPAPQRVGARIAALQGDQPGDLFGFSIAPLPNYTRRGARTFAVSAVRQGLSGSGYVRTFDAQALTPIQTWFLPSGWGPVGLRLAEVSGSSRERAPAVAAAAMRPDGFSVVELRHDPQSPR